MTMKNCCEHDIIESILSCTKREARHIVNSGIRILKENGETGSGITGIHVASEQMRQSFMELYINSAESCCLYNDPEVVEIIRLYEQYISMLPPFQEPTDDTRSSNVRSLNAAGSTGPGDTSRVKRSYVGYNSYSETIEASDASVVNPYNERKDHSYDEHKACSSDPRSSPLEPHKANEYANNHDATSRISITASSTIVKTSRSDDIPYDFNRSPTKILLRFANDSDNSDDTLQVVGMSRFATEPAKTTKNVKLATLFNDEE